MRSIFKNTTALGAFGAALLAAAPGHAAELLTNGGFEQPGSVGSYTQLSNPDLPGWSIDSGNVDVVKVSTYPAYEGNQALDLVGSGVSTGSISQTFATKVGQEYRLKFAYTNNTDSASSVSAGYTVTGAGPDLLAGLVSHAGGTAGAPNWNVFYKSFIADSNSTTLKFADLTGHGNQGIFLDAVSVAVPEPGTWGMMILGLGAVGGVMRRRQKGALRYA